ncbi:MAG: hypothetical protein LUB59_02595, partial [Candidatus Gastranaerophilales bacterium]|nr:hypothetical protein [Candidatus Gastranaerophilales bacterium]
VLLPSPSREGKWGITSPAGVNVLCSEICKVITSPARLNRCIASLAALSVQRGQMGHHLTCSL